MLASFPYCSCCGRPANLFPVANVGTHKVCTCGGGFTSAASQFAANSARESGIEIYDAVAIEPIEAALTVDGPLHPKVKRLTVLGGPTAIELKKEAPSTRKTVTLTNPWQ